MRRQCVLQNKRREPDPQLLSDYLLLLLEIWRHGVSIGVEYVIKWQLFEILDSFPTFTANLQHRNPPRPLIHPKQVHKMALFDIPGWSVSAPPVAESSSHVSKKRKRPASEFNNLQSAEVNLEKLVKRLKGKGDAEVRDSKGKSKAGEKAELKRERERKSKTQTLHVEDKKKTISRPMPLKAVGRTSIVSERPTKRQKTKPVVSEASSTPSVSPAKKVDDASTAGLTVLQKGMKHSLDGARFRCVIFLPFSKYNVSDSVQNHQ
jgi:hypothetical protein